MKYIGIIILLVLCLTLLLFTGCRINKTEAALESGNLENQEDINQSSNDSQSPSTGLVEEPVIEEVTEATVTVYPQKWATGTGTASNPWANDCIKKAYDAVPIGGTIYLSAGYYQLAGMLNVNKQINIIGEGMDKTIIVTTDAAGIKINATDYCTLKGFTIDGDAQGNDDGPTIYIYKCNYTTVEDVEAKNAGSFGIDASESSYSSFHNIYVHGNYEHGIHPGANIKGRNTNNVYRDIHCYNNGANGFDDFGYQGDTNNNVYDNLQCWDNGGKGIAFEYLKGCVLSNSSTSGNDDHGIYMHHNEDINLHDCFVTLSGESGIDLEFSNNISFTNVISKNNNGESGIYINNINGLRFTFCQFYDDRDTPVQEYGISITGDEVDFVELVNCKLMPNKIAAVYNGSGAIIEVNAEKMLTNF